MIAHVDRLDRLLKPLEGSSLLVVEEACRAMHEAQDGLLSDANLSPIAARCIKASCAAAEWAQDESKDQWVIAEQASRGAMCAFLLLTGQVDMARDVAAWNAHWTAANGAVMAGKSSCTSDALIAWRHERSYG